MPDAWRKNMDGNWGLPTVAGVSLDRQLQIPSLGVDKARAEALSNKYWPGNAGGVFAARVYFTVDHALIFDPHFQTKVIQSLTTAHVERVDVLAGQFSSNEMTPSGKVPELIASFT